MKKERTYLLGAEVVVVFVVVVFPRARKNVGMAMTCNRCDVMNIM